MKKNLILFGIFIFLIIGTYIFQEQKSVEDFNEAKLEGRLVDFEVTRLKLLNVEAVKKDGVWWDGKQLLSHNTFNLIEKKLSEIKKIKDIQGEWSTYFPHPFIFEINDTVWTVGDLSLDKQAFYIAKGKDIFLAVIEGDSTQLTQEADEIAAIKLNELITALSKSKENLKETQFFRFYPKLPLERMVVTVEGSLPYEIDIKNNQTLPPPIPGISVHRDLRGKVFSTLTQMTIKEEIPYSEKLRYKKLGVIKILDEKSNVTWELWLRSNDSADAIIIDSIQKRSFLMSGATLKIFFVQLQDYWDKKVIPPKDFLNFTRLNADFYQGDKKARVVILNREPMAFESKKYKVNDLKLEQIIQFIFNLGPQDQAQRVSLLSKTEKQQVLSEVHLRIDVMDQELLLWRKKEELIVVNLTQGFKVHFHLLDENFRGTFEDVLK